MAAIRSRRAIVLTTIAALVVVTIVLAPMGTVGTCVDAASGYGESFCRTDLVSLVGIPSNLFLWLIPFLAVIGAGWGMARMHGRRPAP
ncbi:cytochrome c-type biogenesis protein [Microbacterium gilvum]|uniref:Secreted protein n=1 Tax=Microbacterium gilvum TaxID=1336204 RepID=A0ABP9A5M0_9MICO